MDQKHIRNGLIFVAACILIGLALFAISRFSRSNPTDTDRLDDNQIAASALETRKLCYSAETYDLLKQELFRQAARTRGSDEAAVMQIAGYATLRLEQPLYQGTNVETGQVSCSGSPSIDLPENLVDSNGRQSVNGELSYFVQPSADGNGTVVTVADAETIILALATLATAELPNDESSDVPSDQEYPPEADTSATDADGDSGGSEEQGVVPPAARPVITSSVTGPSFDCDAARTHSEIAVCSNASLSALDREMAIFFRRSLAAADMTQAQRLRQTVNRFLAYRDRCSNDVCIANVYRGRITEIGDIMDGHSRR